MPSDLSIICRRVWPNRLDWFSQSKITEKDNRYHRLHLSSRLGGTLPVLWSPRTISYYRRSNHRRHLTACGIRRHVLSIPTARLQIKPIQILRRGFMGKRHCNSGSGHHDVKRCRSLEHDLHIFCPITVTTDLATLPATPSPLHHCTKLGKSKINEFGIRIRRLDNDRRFVEILIKIAVLDRIFRLDTSSRFSDFDLETIWNQFCNPCSPKSCK